MPVDFSRAKTDLLHRADALDYLKNCHPLPDHCPICNFAIVPKYLLAYHRGEETTEVLCGCPRNECGSLFFAVYALIEMTEYEYAFQRFYPYTKMDKEFPEEVVELSPSFVAVYNQAHHAEQEGLDLVCGVAYRKAIEYLIKDYVLTMYTEDERKIKSMPLQQCIQRFITEPTIKMMSERATWLGNDEAHYIRKWKDKDLKELKNLIDLTVYFISLSRKALRYTEEMVKGEK